MTTPKRIATHTTQNCLGGPVRTTCLTSCGGDALKVAKGKEGSLGEMAETEINHSLASGKR